MRLDPLARRGCGAQGGGGVQAGRRTCLELGVIDDIVPEPEGGAHVDHDEAARLLSAGLVEALLEVENVPQVELRAARRAKFRALGVLA